MKKVVMLIATVGVVCLLLAVSIAVAQDMFGPAVNYAAGVDPACVFSIDFNSDGHNDLATANYSSGNVSILLNLL